MLGTPQVVGGHGGGVGFEPTAGFPPLRLSSSIEDENYESCLDWSDRCIAALRHAADVAGELELIGSHQR